LEEAEIGRKGEEALIYYLNRTPEFKEKFVSCLREKLHISISNDITAKKAPRGYKSDILIYNDAGERIGLSLKTRKPGRPDDHLDRRWLDKPGRLSPSWKDSLQMPDNVYEAFKRGIMRKAVDKNAELIWPEDQSAVKQFLLSKLDDFLEEVLRRGEPYLKLFAVIEYEQEKAVYIFRMDDVIALIKKNIKASGIKFGRTIRLGNFLWIQRKAGNGKRIDARLPKTDPRHPANQLQVKILPIELKDEAIKTLKFCRLDLPSGISVQKGESSLEEWFG